MIDLYASFIYLHSQKILGEKWTRVEKLTSVVAHTFNSSTWEANLSSGPVWSTNQLPKQQGFHYETLSWKTKSNQTKKVESLNPNRAGEMAHGSEGKDTGLSCDPSLPWGGRRELTLKSLTSTPTMCLWALAFSLPPPTKTDTETNKI